MAGFQRFFGAYRHFQLRRFPLQVAIDGLQQILRPFPRCHDHLRDLAVQRIAVASPEVGAGLVAQLRFVFDQLLFKQHPRLKGIKADRSREW